MYDVLETQLRDVNGPQSTKQLRRSGWIPAVLFGEGKASVHLQVEEKKLRKCLAHGHPIFEVKWNGGKELVNLDEIQKNPAGPNILHVSFHKINANQKSVFNVPLHLTNVEKCTGAKEGGVVHLVANSIHVLGLPKDIPDFIDVDVTSLELNGVFHGRDLTLPNGLEVKQSDLDIDIASCSFAKQVADEPAQETPTEGLEPAPTEADAKSESADDTKDAA